MSVLGLLDAMRSELPPAHRLVWLCLENHANGHRFWSISIEQIASELHFSHMTVLRAIDDLQARAIVRIERRHRRKNVYHMLRSYGASLPQPGPDHPPADPLPPDPAPRSSAPEPSEMRIDIASERELEPQIVSQKANSDAEFSLSAPAFGYQIVSLNPDLGYQIVIQSVDLGSQIVRPESTSKNPPERNPPRSERAPTRTPAHTRGGGKAVHAFPIPNDWEPSAEDRLYATARGIDADLAAEDLRNYWGALTGPRACKADWGRTFRNSVLRCADQGRYRIRSNALVVGPTQTPPLDPSRLTGAGALLYRLAQERAAQGLPPIEFGMGSKSNGGAA